MNFESVGKYRLPLAGAEIELFRDRQGALWYRFVPTVVEAEVGSEFELRPVSGAVAMGLSQTMEALGWGRRRGIAVAYGSVPQGATSIEVRFLRRRRRALRAARVAVIADTIWITEARGNFVGYRVRCGLEEHNFLLPRPQLRGARGRHSIERLREKT